MEEYKGFKVGDEVIVTKTPSSWASILNSNCPLHLKFPVTIVIKEIKNMDYYTAMTCGNYGWSLTPMINNNCIIHSVKTLPEEYIVECSSKEETREIGKALYPKDSIWSDMNFWKYIFFAESSKNTREGMCTSRGFNRTIYKDLEYLPVFTYNEWKELFYKQEEMKEEFVLPEKWYIKLTDENKKDIDGWRTCGSLYSTTGFIHSEYPKGTIGYITLFKPLEGHEEITFEQFKKYVLKEETMKAKTFAITGSPALLKAMSEELSNAGYILKSMSVRGSKYIIGQGMNISCKKNGGNLQLFKELGYFDVDIFGYDVSFNLPSQYNEALAFAKEQLSPKYWEEPEVKLPFANLIFTVNKSKGTAICEHGTITKAEIKAVINVVVSPKARLFGYDLEVGVDPDKYLKFGCQTGTLRQAQAILKALE